jgi:hypothetical protein
MESTVALAQFPLLEQLLFPIVSLRSTVTTLMLCTEAKMGSGIVGLALTEFDLDMLGDLNVYLAQTKIRRQDHHSVLDR